MNKTYILANYKQNNQNKIINSFKNSLLGVDIGIKSKNFISIILLSTIIAIGIISLIYYFWRV